MNPVLATLALTSLLTAIGVYLVRKDCDKEDRLEMYFAMFIVGCCFVVDGVLVAALLTAATTR